MVSVNSVGFSNQVFRASAPQGVISPQTRMIFEQTPDNFERQGTSSTTKALVGLGVIAAVGYGIYAAIKGKGLAKLKQSSVLSIQDFKKVGNFKDGKALIDGKGFTGVIEVCKEKGTKKIYENGVLKEAFKNGQKRNYEYANNGKLKRILVNINENNISGKEFLVNTDGSKSVIKHFIKPEIKTTKKIDFTVFSKEKKLMKDGKIQNLLNGEMKTHTGLKNAGMDDFTYKVVKDAKTGKLLSAKIADTPEYIFDQRYGSGYYYKLSDYSKDFQGNKYTRYYGRNTGDYTRKQKIDNINGIKAKYTEFYDKKGKLSFVSVPFFDKESGIRAKLTNNVRSGYTTIKVVDKKSGQVFDISKDKNGNIVRVFVSTKGSYAGEEGTNLKKDEIFKKLFGENSEFTKACKYLMNHIK